MCEVRKVCNSCAVLTVCFSVSHYPHLPGAQRETVAKYTDEFYDEFYDEFNVVPVLMPGASRDRETTSRNRAPGNNSHQSASSNIEKSMHENTHMRFQGTAKKEKQRQTQSTRGRVPENIKG